MPYRVCKTIDIENGHMLSKHPDACRFPHGHTRRIEFILEAADLDANEMVCDFKIIKDAVGAFLESLDHALCVNTDDPAFATLRALYGETPPVEAYPSSQRGRIETDLKNLKLRQPDGTTPGASRA